MTVHLRDVHVRRAGELAGCLAVAYMVAEEKVERGFAGLSDLLVEGCDLHSVNGLHGAGREEPAAGIFYQANHAGSEMGQVTVVAHRWDHDSELPGGFHYRGAVFGLNAFSVDG